MQHRACLSQDAMAARTRVRTPALVTTTAATARFTEVCATICSGQIVLVLHPTNISDLCTLLPDCFVFFSWCCLVLNLPAARHIHKVLYSICTNSTAEGPGVQQPTAGGEHALRLTVALALPLLPQWPPLNSAQPLQPTLRDCLCLRKTPRPFGTAWLGRLAPRNI